MVGLGVYGLNDIRQKAGKNFLFIDIHPSGPDGFDGTTVRISPHT